MIKNILQILVVVVVGVLVYNFFLGTPEEKQNARTIFNEVKDVGVAVKDLLQSEKEKFDAGKYDNALDQIGNLFDNMKTEAREFDEQYLDRIEDLERKRPRSRAEGRLGKRSGRARHSRTYAGSTG
jgi:basic membrane lipoprotein Med (substrate-binding protein (PBP1-ABC) superfamily)